MGYYFVLVEYRSGRCGYSVKRYISERAAAIRAAARRKRSDVKSARVCYQPSLNDVDIKKFI